MYATLYVRGVSKVLRLSRLSREALDSPERVLISRVPDTNTIFIRACSETQFGLKVSNGYISANGFLRELWQLEEVPSKNIRFECIPVYSVCDPPAILCVPQEDIQNEP